MPRVFVPHPLQDSDNPIILRGEPSRYLNNVLRAHKGDEVVLFDESGHHLRARILSVRKTHVELEGLEPVVPGNEPAHGLVLLQGILKGGGMDTVIQKTTELGIKRIVPVVTERSQVRETRKVARWRKIAMEAARQSGRPRTPEVSEPVDFHDAVSLSAAMVTKVFFWEDTESSFEPRVDFSVSDAAVAIGPEGGFSPEEAALARENGFSISTMGANILRSETAAVAAAVYLLTLGGRLFPHSK